MDVITEYQHPKTLNRSECYVLPSESQHSITRMIMSETDTVREQEIFPWHIFLYYLKHFHCFYNTLKKEKRKLV